MKQKIKFNLKYKFMRYLPSIFHSINYFRFPDSAAAIENDIIIDGYMRSSNTFSYHAFKYLNEESSISHHRHSSAGLLFGIKNNIPILLLIRKPSDVFISTYIFKNQEISFKDIAKSWIMFYEALLPFKNKIFVGDFNIVTKDFSKVIKNINNFYGKNFNYYTKNNFNDLIFQNIKKVHKNVNRQILHDTIALPNKKRIEKKTLLNNKMENEIPNLLEQSNKLYSKFIK